MKQLLILAFMLTSFTSFSQKVDTVINTGTYKAYVSLKLKEPLYVAYKLYKGGGDNSRTGYRFHNDIQIPLIGAKDYSHSGYDEGHLANAEDFANNAKNEEKTFRFYNCIPQTPNLNRGIWKVWETEIRKESQTDSLYVICGGVWTENRMVKNMPIPDHCWKIVISLTTKQFTHILWFTNELSGNYATVVPMDKLSKLVNYKIVY